LPATTVYEILFESRLLKRISIAERSWRYTQGLGEPLSNAVARRSYG
jgi:hypothetical protein